MYLSRIRRRNFTRLVTKQTTFIMGNPFILLLSLLLIVWAVVTIVAVSKEQLTFSKNLLGEEYQEKSLGSSGSGAPDKNTDASYNKLDIQLIALIGERNSGTRWSFSHLQACFNHSVKVKDRLTRHKHWFQHDIDVWKGEKPNVLVVSQFRDPYYWVEAMRARPHHSPSHFDVLNRKSVDWTAFVTTPWSVERPSADLSMLKSHNGTEKTLDCQENFKYHQIVSCASNPYNDNRTHRFCAHTPQYELKLDESGEVYDSIVDLRADKIRNHLEVADWGWVKHFMKVRYEDLLDFGTELMISHISNVTGIKPNCNPFPAQNNRKKRQLKPSFVKWMNDHVDWNAEALIGYEKMASA